MKLRPLGILRYAVILTAAMMLWWYFRTYELMLVVIMIISMAALSLYALFRYQKAFSLAVSLPGGGIGKNRDVPMSIHVKSLCKFIGFAMEVSYVVRNVFTEFEIKQKERIWAAPGITPVVDKEMLSRHVGRVEVSVTDFVIFDWLGMCSLKLNAHKGSWVIVAPRMALPESEDLVNSVEDFPEENETKKRGTDVNPDYEVREYIPGDELKSIHWKLTAKTGRTMVRERLASGRDKINVLLALTDNEEENDGLMASLHGLSLLLLNKGYPIRLCWLGYGGQLQGQYLAEEGELENAIDEILSVSGKKDQEKARNAMETEFPGEAYILVKNGAYKGAYVR